MDPSTTPGGTSHGNKENAVHQVREYYNEPLVAPQPIPQYIPQIILQQPPPPTPRSKKKFICALLCFLIIVIVFIIALAIVFAVIGSRHKHHPHRDESPGPSGPKPTVAIAGHLDFPGLYPPIEFKSGPECRALWSSLNSVPCHDRLLDRGNDNGTFRLMGWDPMYYVPKICTTECQSALNEASDQLFSKCLPADEFIVDGYTGMFNVSLLEFGPIEAVYTLKRRADYMCRASPNGDSDYQFCPIEMYERFAVNDGMNANLNGIGDFISSTAYKHIEPAQWKTGMRGTSTYSYNYHYQVRQQSYGPGKGDTSCGWCTFDFLNHTLRSWTKRAVVDPESKQPVLLSDFISQVKEAGDRCSPTDTWTKIYDDAMAYYRSKGFLVPDVDGNRTSRGL